MRYNVSINGKKYIVEVERAQGVYKQMQRHPLGTVAAAPAVSTVTTETPVAAAPKAAPVQAAAPAPAPAPVPAQAPAPVQEVKAAAPAAGEGTEIPSPMPGNVFDIRVAAGDSVAAGQVVIVLEAMRWRSRSLLRKQVRSTRSSSLRATPLIPVQHLRS